MVTVATKNVTVPTECGVGIIIIIIMDSSYGTHIFWQNKISMH